MSPLQQNLYDFFVSEKWIQKVYTVPCIRVQNLVDTSGTKIFWKAKSQDLKEFV